MKIYIPHYLHEKKNKNAVSDIFLSVVENYKENNFKFSAIGDFNKISHNLRIYECVNKLFCMLMRLYLLFTTDIIWTVQGDKISYFFAIAFNKKIIVSIHADYSTLKNNCISNKTNQAAYCKYGLFKLLECADLIIASSKYGLRSLEKDYGRKVKYVYNGVDFDYFTNDIDVKNKQFTVCFIGRYIESKRPCLIYRIAKKMPDVNFIMAGGYTNQSYLSGLDKPENIESFGWVSRKKIKEIYKASDVMVFPSLSEGFGLVILEANACGLPVVASDIPVFREIISEQNGLLIKVDGGDEVKQYVNAISYFRENKINTRKHIMGKGIYTWEAVSKNYLSIFKNEFIKANGEKGE